MERVSRRLLPYVVVSLLGLAGVLLCLVGPMPPAGAQDSRLLQVWPDRSIGVTSRLLEGSTAYATTQVLPFGVCRTSEGDVVRARTYLHFPLDAFPPGTEVLRATLYVYVDSSSDAGEATFGVYRVLEPWEEAGWDSDSITWPVLLTLPIAATIARFDVVAPTLPLSTPVPTAPPTFIATPTVTATETSDRNGMPASSGALDKSVFSASRKALASAMESTSTPSTSPLPTPTLTPSPTPTSPTSPLSTPTSTSTPGPTPTSTPGPTPTPSTAPSPTPISPLPPAAPVAVLGQAAETWLTWDITALMRAWLAGEVPDDGLALATAPDPDADPETTASLLVARWLAADDPGTRPYLIAEFEVHPVTPTPTPVPILPPAGNPAGCAGWRAVGLLLVGAALLTLGLIVRRT